jgi:chromosome partitioning protein
LRQTGVECAAIDCRALSSRSGRRTASAEYLSTLGIAHIQKSINNLFNSANSDFELDKPAFKKPELVGVIFNRLRFLTGGTSNEEKRLKRIRSEYGDQIFDTTIPQSQKIAERPEQSEPIALSDYAADRDYTTRIHKAAEEFYDRITRPHG